MFIGFLWLAQVLVFAVGACGSWRDADGSRPILPVRISLSASLVLSAGLLWWQAGSETSSYSGSVFVGMFLSFVGDLFMAKLIPFPNRLVGGMLAFGSAHWMYIRAYRLAVAQAGIALPTTALWVGLLVYSVTNIGGWWWLIRNPAKETIVNLGALLYGSWIGVMASFALAMASALGGAWWLAALGGAVFVSSDFLIGITDIRGVHLENERAWVWFTYLAGQMGIVYAPWLLGH